MTDWGRFLPEFVTDTVDAGTVMALVGIVEIAAVRGERFEQGAYQDRRAVLRLAPGRSAPVVWDLDFQPERIVVDPDALVLQLLALLLQVNADFACHILTVVEQKIFLKIK